MKFFDTKINKIFQTITPFAGISYIHAEFNSCGLSQLIDNELGNRAKNAKYSYSDIFSNWTNIFFCGGECAEDIQIHLHSTLQNIPYNNAPSPDTMLRGIKELAEDNIIVTSNSEKIYQFNINKKMNNLNIKSLILTGELQAGKMYDFDYDNQIIEHEKYDAKRTYKKTTGYFPGVATIDNKIVYIENRDGNANVKTGQAQTLERAYNLLKKNKIEIYRSRMDAGSYAKDIIEVVAANSKLFYIRANRCDTLTEQICQIEEWESIEINDKIYEVSSIKFTQFFEDKEYRLVVMREKNENPQLDLFTGNNFTYRCILTNDWESTEKEVIEYYNYRGCSEKIFDVMNNDFGWRHLPCSDMQYNTSYLILTAIIKNFYNYIIKKVSKVFADIPPSARLKKFIFRFICVPGRWVYRARKWTLNLYTDRPYEKLVV